MMDSEFDRHAASYDEDLQHALSVTGEDKEYFNRGRMIWLAKKLEQHGHRSEAVLDFGCGTGSATPWIFRHLKARRILGVDVSSASLEIASERFGSSNAEFQNTDAPMAGAFDVAFCNGVFHHIAPDGRMEALDYIHDSLRPGGWFALFENNPWNPGTRHVMRRCVFDQDAIPLAPPETRRRMRDAGFEILGTRYLFVFPALLKAFRFLEAPLSPFPLGGQYVVLGKKHDA